MSDPDLVTAAYEDNIKKVWANFLMSYITSQSPKDVSNAQDGFVNGVRIARTIRDDAHQLLISMDAKPASGSLV